MNTAPDPVRFLALLIALAAFGVGRTWAQSPPDNSPSVPVVSIVATRAETSELLCPPNTCLAPVPAPGVLVVRRSGGNLANSLSVMLRIGGTATPGSDYERLPESAVIPAGQESVELYVQASFDELAEGDETVRVELLPDPSMGPVERYRVDPARSSAQVVIHDRTPPPPEPVVSIEAAQPIAEESSFPYRRMPWKGRFTISRTGPANNSLSVFVLYGGSASSGKDYEALPWLVSIPAGAASIDLDVVAIPDDLAEPIEIVEAQLSECPPPTDPPMGIPCRQVNIDPVRSSARVFIREDGVTTASLEITAPKDGAQFSLGATIPIEATAIDLEGAIPAVDFFDGDTKIGESRISFFQQPPPGTPIQHQFHWTQAALGAHALNARAINTAGNSVTSQVVFIQVVSTVPVVSIVATRAETHEPLCPPNTCEAPEPAPGLLLVRRSGGDLANSLSVMLRIGGTATPGSDYERLPEFAVIPAGQESVELYVQASFDELAEGDETVRVELLPDPSMGPVEHYRVDPAQSSAQVVVHDRTPPPSEPVVHIVATDPLAREGTNSAGEINTATFLIRRSGETNEPLTVHFEIGGTATSGVDYDQLPGSAVIPAGKRSVALTITPIDDRQREHAETVVVKLVPSPEMNPLPGYTLGTPRRAAAMIVDNDRPRPGCVRLSDGLFNLCIPVNSNGCFRIEATDDLRLWVKLCTLPANDGAAHFIDPDGADLPRRFYRVIPEPCDPQP